jgi:isopentenyl phosphate kinase
MSERILLKLGGSILTEKGNPGVAKSKCIEDVAQLISRHTGGQICIVHGAGSFGHPEAHLYNLASGGYGLHLAEGIVRTHDAVCALNAILVSAFVRAGREAVGIHPLGSAVSRHGRLVAIETRPISALMRAGIVPALHGDVVMDETQGVSIVSGDQIVRVLAEIIPFTRIGLATDVPGVLGSNGRIVDEIGPDSTWTVHASGSRHTDVTGGMEGKLKELLELAEIGIESHIFHISRLGDFMEGRPHGGTRISGREANG